MIVALPFLFTSRFLRPICFEFADDAFAARIYFWVFRNLCTNQFVRYTSRPLMGVEPSFCFERLLYQPSRLEAAQSTFEKRVFFAALKGLTKRPFFLTVSNAALKVDRAAFSNPTWKSGLVLIEVSKVQHH